MYTVRKTVRPQRRPCFGEGLAVSRASQQLPDALGVAGVDSTESRASESRARRQIHLLASMGNRLILDLDIHELSMIVL